MTLEKTIEIANDAAAKTWGLLIKEFGSLYVDKYHTQLRPIVKAEIEEAIAKYERGVLQ